MGHIYVVLMVFVYICSNHKKEATCRGVYYLCKGKGESVEKEIVQMKVVDSVTMSTAVCRARKKLSCIKENTHVCETKKAAEILNLNYSKYCF